VIFPLPDGFEEMGSFLLRDIREEAISNLSMEYWLASNNFSLIAVSGCVTLKIGGVIEFEVLRYDYNETVNIQPGRIGCSP